MAAPADLTEEQAADLRVYMTPAGFQAALTTFGEETMARFVARRPDCLMLAAADLLDGLPTAADAGTGKLASFKLDVLEFKYAAGSEGVSFGDLAAGLRTRAKTQCGPSGGGTVTANPAPSFEEWGIR